RLDRLRDGDKALKSTHQSDLQPVASEERLLADETERLKPRLIAAPAFEFAVATAADEMRRAGGLLLRGETGLAPQEAERWALARLKHILAALRPEEPT